VFFGSYEHNVDIKGRLAVPIKFRNALEAGMFITRSVDKCLALYTDVEFQKLASEYEALPTTDPDARALQRNFFSGASPCEFDKQGRITVPQELRKYAAIEGEDVTVMVIGVNNRIEIWSKERWEHEQEVVEEKGSEMAARMGNLQLV
jgi:MraZ protein